MLLIDTHVHIHDCFPIPTFMDAAFSNFKAEAVRRGCRNGFTAALLLTETAKDNWFRRLSELVDAGPEVSAGTTGAWTLHRTRENESLIARRGSHEHFFLIAGHQIVTREHLEVLSLAADERFEDGAPLEEVIRAVRECDGIPVIPWGFGKWTGRRGNLLKDLLSGPAPSPGFFLGDNSGRPVFGPRPSLFRLAEEKGIRVLPGSDPLPFASEVRRAGSYGCRIGESLSFESPAEDIRRILADSNLSFRTYGNLESPYRFFRNQVAMQIKKRHNRRKESAS